MGYGNALGHPKHRTFKTVFGGNILTLGSVE